MKLKYFLLILLDVSGWGITHGDIYSCVVVVFAPCFLFGLLFYSLYAQLLLLPSFLV